MSTATPDRRILKAFYTQYVAVLLIIMVCAATAIARQENNSLNEQEPAVAPALAPLGELFLKSSWSAEGDIPVDAAGELTAIAEVLRNHDVQMILRLPPGTGEDGQTAVRRAQAQALKLKTFMVSRGVPSESVRTVLRYEPSSAGKASVVFNTTEVSHEK